MMVKESNLKDVDLGLSYEIRVLTLNIWGIPRISKDREERVIAIAEKLSSVHEPYHYVFLQEIWSKTDYSYVAEKVANVLPYSHYFHSGVMGAGICIFSCSPIEETHFHKYSLNGHPQKILHGDWFGGKGLAMCKTSYKGIPISLVNTHLHAEYDHVNNEYVCHRVVQAYELAQVVRFVQGGTHVSIFCGDLNCETTDVPYKLITSNTGYVDTFYDSPVMPADEIGATNETAGNSYTTPKALKLDPNGKRIDYIFHWSSKDYQVKTLVLDQPWPPRVPQKSFSYSDHEAVRAVLTIQSKENNEVDNVENNVAQASFNRTDALLDASAVCTQGLRAAKKRQKCHMAFALAFSIIAVVLLGLNFKESTSALRFFCNCVQIACCIFCTFYVVSCLVLCNIELNALRATKEGLERLLSEVRKENAQLFEEQNKKVFAPKQ